MGENSVGARPCTSLAQARSVRLSDISLSLNLGILAWARARIVNTTGFYAFSLKRNPLAWVRWPIAQNKGLLLEQQLKQKPGTSFSYSRLGEGHPLGWKQQISSPCSDMQHRTNSQKHKQIFSHINSIMQASRA